MTTETRILQTSFAVLAVSACVVFGAPQGAQYYSPSSTTPIPIIAQSQELNLDGSYQYR